LTPTDAAPLADYLPYFNLLREILKEHTDQILLHPITISVKPGDLFLLKDLLPFPLVLWWTSPHLVILMAPIAVRLNGIPQWQHLLRNNILQWFSWLMPILMPIFLALLFLSFFPCIILHVYCC
jgi:hypothetical protein